MGSPSSAGLIGTIALSLICPYKVQSQCGTPPTAFNPYNFRMDSHTYNPYSSKDNDVANINHEPKMPGERGHWVSKTYHVSCCSDDGLFRQTYVTSFVISELTKQPATFGSGLQVNNASDKYPLYFGVDGLLNDRLGPRESKIIHLPRYQPGTGPKHAVVASLYVKYWDDGGGVTANTSCETDPSVWYDKGTGLMWAKKTNDQNYTYAEAADYCQNLGLAGHLDWRLPTLSEVQAIGDINTQQMKGGIVLSQATLWTNTPGNGPDEVWVFSIKEPPFTRRTDPNPLHGIGRKALCVRVAR